MKTSMLVSLLILSACGANGAQEVDDTDDVKEPAPSTQIADQPVDRQDPRLRAPQLNAVRQPPQDPGRARIDAMIAARIVAEENRQIALHTIQIPEDMRQIYEPLSELLAALNAAPNGALVLRGPESAPSANPQ